MKRVFLVGLIIVIAGFIALVVFLPGYTKQQELRNQEKALRDEIAALRAANQKLIEERTLLESDLTHLEKVLRNEMGLVKPGEVVYKVVEEDAVTASLEKRIDLSATASPSGVTTTRPVAATAIGTVKKVIDTKVR